MYGIYWVNAQRMYFVIPYEGYEGFLVMSEFETEVIDSQLEEVFVLRGSSTNGTGSYAKKNSPLIQYIVDSYKRLNIMSN